MKKKIKALILAIIICITTFFSNIVNASATVPGIVEAESVWMAIDSIFLSLGVSADFMPDKSISYNNELKKQEMKDYIDKELQDGVITQQMHDDAIQNLDNILLAPQVHDPISIGEALWTALTHFFYDNYIKSSPNLISSLSPSALVYFNNYSGTCAIYSIFASNDPAQTSIVVFSEGAYAEPVYKRLSGKNSLWEIASFNGQYYTMLNDGTLTLTSGTSTKAFVGQGINVQYIPNKAVNETITNNNENALVTGSSYSDYTDRLADVYSFSNGQVVVTDTGEAPTVLDGDTIADTVDGINDGTIAWENAIPQIYANDETGAIEGETPVIGKKALDEMVGGLNLNRLKTKFPFCIPSDLKQMISGAGETDDEAPTITVPCHIEFAGHVYYDSDELFVIDFNELENVVAVFRAGFFLLFLIGMVFLTIEVLHSFFVVTE